MAFEWSPNSEWLASTRSFHRGLFVVNATTLELTELSAEPSNSYASWSTDSRWLAFFKGSSLMLWNTENFITRELATVGDAHLPAWSPDSSRLAVSFAGEEQSGLLLIEPESGNQQVIDLGVAPSTQTL